MSKRYILTLFTNWVGEEEKYSIITDDIQNPELLSNCQDAAYNNFEAYGGIGQIMEEVFSDEEGNYTDEQWDQAYSIEHDYYDYSIEEFEGDDEEFETYDVFWEY